MKGTKDTNYVFPKKEDVEIVVGDEKQDRFYPRMKIMRWDNEVNFSVGVISDHIGSDTQVSNKIEWNDGHGTKARFYEKEGDEFEFEIELTSKPSSNVIELSIETKGLDFFYQPELTEEEKEAVIIIDGKEVPKYDRPENIVGSYAVYHRVMKGEYIYGNNYRAGKAFHIYKPYATDAKGIKVWCDLNIEDNMQITIPQDFINNAVYPITIDPTFGCNPAIPGSSSVLTWGDTATGSLFTTPSNIASAQSFTAYINSGGMLKVIIKGMFVLHSNLNIISNGIGNAVQRSNWGADWETSVFSTNPTPTPSTDHILMVVNDDGIWNHYDSGSTDQGHYDDTNSFTSPTNLGTATHDNNLYSIYCTYEATAATGTRTPRTFNGSLRGPFRGPI